MSTKQCHIALLYNDDSQVRHGSPQDLLAVQSTVSTTQNVYDALASLGYSIFKIAVRDSLEDLSAALHPYSPASTFIFNNCDGFNGSNQDASLIVHLLEDLGFCHTGAPASAVELCIDKARAKQCLVQHGVPTPRCQVFETPLDEFNLDFPVIVKPAVEDGSIGITLKSVVSTPRQLRRQVKEILDVYEEPALVEQFIPGRELGVAMLGNDPIQVLPIAEDDYSRIANPLARLLTYESKWDPDSSYYKDIPSCIPADLDSAEYQVVSAAARSTFKAIGLRDLGRVDFRLLDGIPYVIDVNELPDLAFDGGFWKSAEVAGMTYPQMVESIIVHALKREGWNP